MSLPPPWTDLLVAWLRPMVHTVTSASFTLWPDILRSHFCYRFSSLSLISDRSMPSVETVQTDIATYLPVISFLVEWIGWLETIAFILHRLSFSYLDPCLQRPNIYKTNPKWKWKWKTVDASYNFTFSFKEFWHQCIDLSPKPNQWTADLTNELDGTPSVA